MSLAHGQPSSVAIRTGLTIVWAIARDAVRRANPTLDLPPARGRQGEVLLCLSVSETGCTAELRDASTDRVHPIELGAVHLDRTEAGEFVHLEVTELRSPLLSATYRRSGSGERLLYARTPVLDRLGIRGGRYGRPRLVPQA